MASIWSSSKGSVGEAGTLIGFSAATGFVRSHSRATQKWKKPLRRSCFLYFEIGLSVQVLRNCVISSTPICLSE